MVIPDKTLRIYPENFPAFENEPTKDKFEIIQSKEYGEGLISKTYFNPGEIVLSFTGLILNYVTLYTLQQRPGVHIHDPYVMGKVLHNCSPNMECNMLNLTFTALKEIKPGDYLTMDYETTEDVLYRPFYCQCGSPQCRGRIRGKSFVNEKPELLNLTLKAI